MAPFGRQNHAAVFPSGKQSFPEGKTAASRPPASLEAGASRPRLNYIYIPRYELYKLNYIIYRLIMYEKPMLAHNPLLTVRK